MAEAQMLYAKTSKISSFFNFQILSIAENREKNATCFAATQRWIIHRCEFMR